MNILIPAVCMLLIAGCRSEQKTGNEDWPNYGGNKAGNRYSTLKQINKDNVDKLQIAWTFDTGDNKDSAKRGMDMQTQPIVVHGVLYGVTPGMKLFALDAATGSSVGCSIRLLIRHNENRDIRCAGWRIGKMAMTNVSSTVWERLFMR